METHHIKDARRGFLHRVLAMAGLAVAAPAAAQEAGRRSPGGQPVGAGILPAYATARQHRSLKQSSHDRSGANNDRWSIEPGATQELFNSTGAGCITHMWFTIAAASRTHLKELVLRMTWDGAAKPSVETPIGDFFGLNLGEYVIYESEYLGCSPGRSLNCYFAMPYRKSARVTVTNEGKERVSAFYSNIDYMSVGQLPADALYFHAQYRQAAPCLPVNKESLPNPSGANNYVFTEAWGRGHLMGVTLGVYQNSELWMGEGDDMIFIDDEKTPAIIGTGLEDYFLGSWNFGGRDGARPFAHRQYGAPFIALPERTGGRYLCYRFHGDNPVTFQRYLKHTAEHGHANNRSDNYYSCCYWYQDQPAQRWVEMPSTGQRIPRLTVVDLPGGVRPA